MFLRYIPVLFSPLALPFATAISNPAPQLGLVDSPQQLINSSNAGPAPPPLNALNEIQIHCDGEKYGTNPNVQDCEDARTHYTRSSLVITYGVRHVGLGPSIFPLPYRLMGSQALCYFEPVLIDDYFGTGTGIATINQISAAAYELILQCAVRHSQGGIATGIGGENIAVVLGTYQPDVQCGSSFSDWPSCRSVLGDMPAFEYNMIFGPIDNPTVQVPVPMIMQSNDKKCVVRLFGTGGTDILSWFEVWEAVTAVYAKCTRRGRVGSFRGLGASLTISISPGELGSIFFTMTKSPFPSDSLAGNVSVVTLSGGNGLDEE